MSEDARHLAVEGLLLFPRLVRLLGRLLGDPSVSRFEKSLLVATLAYVANPFDFLPDAVPVLGQVDDLYLAGLILLRFLNRAGEERLRAHWTGPGDLAAAVRRATSIATSILPGLVRRRIDGRVGRWAA